MGLEEGCRRDLNNDGWLEETNSFWLGLEGALWLGWDKGCSWNVLVVVDEKECRILLKYRTSSGLLCTRVKKCLVSEVSYPLISLLDRCRSSKTPEKELIQLCS
jgi:hypothetical protein